MKALIGCGLGEGLEPTFQGLLTYLTNSQQSVQLFTTVAVADTLGGLIRGHLTRHLIAIERRPRMEPTSLRHLVVDY